MNVHSSLIFDIPLSLSSAYIFFSFLRYYSFHSGMLLYSTTLWIDEMEWMERWKEDSLLDMAKNTNFYFFFANSSDRKNVYIHKFLWNNGNHPPPVHHHRKRERRRIRRKYVEIERCVVYCCKKEIQPPPPPSTHHHFPPFSRKAIAKIKHGGTNKNGFKKLSIREFLVHFNNVFTLQNMWVHLAKISLFCAFRKRNT